MSEPDVNFYTALVQLQSMYVDKAIAWDVEERHKFEDLLMLRLIHEASTGADIKSRAVAFFAVYEPDEERWYT